MTEASHNLMTRTLANGATAQIRELAEFAKGEEARRLYTELMRIARKLADKHDYDFTGDRRKTEAFRCD
jgi:hypothetical protein